MCNLDKRENEQNSQYQGNYQNQNEQEMILNSDDVVSISAEDVERSQIIPNESFTVSQFESKTLASIWNNHLAVKRLKEGFQAQVLSPNNTWRKGKVEVQIECKLIFTPEDD